MSYNPFISTTDNGREYLTSNCSLNKVKLAKLPVYGIEDSIEGKSMSELFGAGIIIDEIKGSASSLGINLADYKEMDLPKVLDMKINEGNEEALRIARKYGNRLGMLLLVLKTGLYENRLAREDWDEFHWEYWKNIKTIYLAGGLASGRLGEYMLEVVRELFEKADVPMYRIVRNTNGSEIGAKGCLTQLTDDNDVHILFDLGQTKIKRIIAVRRYQDHSVNDTTSENITYENSTYENSDSNNAFSDNGQGDVEKENSSEPCAEGHRVINDGSDDDFDKEFRLIKLPSRKSINMEWYIEDENERRRQAEELHYYIVDSIVDTYNEALQYGPIRWEIVISIASYVMDGKVHYARSGYAKLCMLSDNYAGYLAAELERRLNRKLLIQLVHDGTAASLYFKGAKNAVCITAGTAFGVGFPEIQLM